jgi:predicted aspartyl protease
VKFVYNPTYFPPAPFTEIWLGLPDESLKVGPLVALLDTGADATLVPIRHLQTLPKMSSNRHFLRSQCGERRIVIAYRLDIGIAEIRFPAIEIVADDQGDEIIIGRDVLNKLRIMLNGPKQIVEISE